MLFKQCNFIESGLFTSWMYCMINGEALRLSTGHLKKPWISFECKSIVINPVKPRIEVNIWLIITAHKTGGTWTTGMCACYGTPLQA